MITLVLSAFVDLFVFIFNALIIIRVISSYFVDPHSGFFRLLLQMTEPVIAPVRRLLPQMAGLDLAPLATFFALQGVQWLLHRLLGA